MKQKMKMIALTAGILLSLFSSAQESYTIKMTMKIDGLPPEYAAVGEQEITTYVREHQQKSEITSMMGSTIVYFDGKKMTSLMDQMGQKRGFTATKEELEADEKARGTTKPVIQYTNETKNIAGYDCKKAIITNVDKNKQETRTIVWYTDKIKINQMHSGKTTRGMVDLGDLKGYPLGLEMTQNAQGMDMKSTITATEVITGPIDDSVFVVNTAGYQMMAYKEMKELQKAGMMGK